MAKCQACIKLIFLRINLLFSFSRVLTYLFLKSWITSFLEKQSPRGMEHAHGLSKPPHSHTLTVRAAIKGKERRPDLPACHRSWTLFLPATTEVHLFRALLTNTNPSRSGSVAKSCLTLLRPHRTWPARLLCPWDPPGKNTGEGCHFLLQGIFLSQGSNPGLLCLLLWQADSLPTYPPEKPC